MGQRLGAALLGVLCGCGGSLQVKVVDATHRRPSNVAVYFSVDAGDGEAVSGLQASDFEIHEDGSRISSRESRQTLLKPEVAAAHYTLLLVDMSSSAGGVNRAPMIAEAAREFVKELSSRQRVAVYAFDGSSTLHRIQSFSSVPKPDRTLERLQRFTSKNPSTNLYGAVGQALSALDGALSRAKEPLRFGTLVVYMDGPDRAAQLPTQQLDKAIAATELDIFAIGMGNAIDDFTAARVGMNGYVLVQDPAALTRAFRTISARIVAFTDRYYLLSYCSPARAGEHDVRVRVNDRRSGAKGKLRFSLDAQGFKPRCDPKQPPRFDVSGQTHGTVRRGTAPRGLPLQVRTDLPLTHHDVDPEQGDNTAESPATEAAPSATPDAAKAVDIEALENELPPGLQHHDETEPDD